MRTLPVMKSTVSGTSRRIALAVGLAAALALSNAAAAPNPDESFRFAYNTIELRGPHATEKLYRRLDLAVRRYCAIAGGKSASDKRMERNCRDTTLAESVRQVNNDGLTAVYKRRHADRYVASL